MKYTTIIACVVIALLLSNVRPGAAGTDCGKCTSQKECPDARACEERKTNDGNVYYISTTKIAPIYRVCNGALNGEDCPTSDFLCGQLSAYADAGCQTLLRTVPLNGQQCGGTASAPDDRSRLLAQQ